MIHRRDFTLTEGYAFGGPGKAIPPATEDKKCLDCPTMFRPRSRVQKRCDACRVLATKRTQDRAQLKQKRKREAEKKRIQSCTYQEFA